MNCPLCQAESSVIDSRPGKYGVRRRRQCDRCMHRWNTYELAQSAVERFLEMESAARQVAAVVAREA